MKDYYFDSVEENKEKQTICDLCKNKCETTNNAHIYNCKKFIKKGVNK